MAEQQQDAPKPMAVQVSPASLKVPAAPTPNEPAAVVEAPKAPEADPLAPRFQELEKAHAKAARERREIAEQRKAIKAQLDEIEQYKKLRADRNRNPDKYLKADYGDDYYDKLTRYKTEGAPPSDLIASEVEELKTTFQKQLEEQKNTLQKQLADEKAQEAERAKNEYLSGAVEHAKSNPDKYKLLAKFTEAKLGSYDAVAQKIDSHFRSTMKQNVDGTWQPGVTLTFEQAAQEVEKEISKIGEVFKALFAEEAKTKPATMPAKQQDPTRRSNVEPPAKRTDAERWRAALAAGEAAMASRQQN